MFFYLPSYRLLALTEQRIIFLNNFEGQCSIVFELSPVSSVCMCICVHGCECVYVHVGWEEGGPFHSQVSICSLLP